MAGIHEVCSGSEVSSPIIMRVVSVGVEIVIFGRPLDIFLSYGINVHVRGRIEEIHVRVLLVMSLEESVNILEHPSSGRSPPQQVDGDHAELQRGASL